MSSQNPLQRTISTYQMDELRELQAELSERKVEALRLYKPTPQQNEFHRSISSETLVLGGNRSGKSLCTFIEDAFAATGTHPVEGKYPKENGNLVIIGANWKHIGLVVVPYLFREGAFKIIKDEQSGEWRAYDPVADEARKAEARPAPPLIPPRMIKAQSWLLKSAGYLNSCTLHNGWTIYCFSSEGDPPQGFQADLVHFDEDVTNETWVPEMQARLADRKGKLVWSAMPWSKNEALIGLSDRADRAEEEGTSDIKKFTLRFLDNVHIDKDERRKMIERWSAIGDDVLRQRAEGEFITDSILVYPNFSPHIHGLDPSELPHGQIPEDWCRYAVVDPGHSITAVLFAAVPPDESKIVLYDELYIRKCNALIFGDEMRRKVQGHRFYAFLIDAHGAKLTDIGSGRSPQEQYEEVLRANNVRSEVTGSSFIPGSDNIQAGLEATRLAMHIQPSGLTRLRYIRSRLPNFEREMKRYKKKTQVVGGVTITTDEPSKRGEFHLVDCLRYLCSYDPEYHKPREAEGEDPWWVAWKKKRDKSKDKGIVYLAPSSYTFTYEV
jgi:hypothetical protein